MRIICLGDNASYRLLSLFPFDILDSYLVTLEKNVLNEVILTSQNNSRMSFRLLWSDKNDGRRILHLSCTNVRSGLGYPRKLTFGRNWLKPRIRSRWPLKIVFTRLITPSVSILLTKAVKCYFESWTHASVENYCLLSITFALWTLSWSRGTRRKCPFCPSAYPSVPSNRLRLLVCEGRHLWKLFE